MKFLYHIWTHIPNILPYHLEIVTLRLSRKIEISTMINIGADRNIGTAQKSSVFCISLVSKLGKNGLISKIYKLLDGEFLRK